MKKILIFPKFDPRLAADLAKQRPSIMKGLSCTAISALLYGGLPQLIKFATGSIETLYKSSDPHLTMALREDLEVSGSQALILSCSLVVVLFALRYTFTRGQIFYLSEAANRLSADLRKRMFGKLIRLPVSYFNDRRSGAIQSVLTNDVNVYQGAVAVIKDSAEGPIKAIVAFGSIFFIQWQLACVAILLIPGMVTIIQRNSRRLKVAQNEVQVDLASVSATTLEVLQGTRVVKAFGAEQRVETDYRSLVDKSLDSQMKSVSLIANLRPMVELLGAVGLAVVFYFAGLLAKRGELQVSEIAALLVAMDTINQGFKALGNVSNTYAGVEAASNRIYSQILDVEEAHETLGGVIPTNVKGQIEFRDVSFNYPDGTPALQNVSFRIDPGASLALVGPSGAGKSTIADLMLRFYEPTSGQVLFDGVDVRELDIAWLRSQIGVVPQQTFLFAGSIEDNVRLGSSDATSEDFTLALEQAHATDFVRDMDNRETPVLGERGVRLSGGQMQRVAIARALIRKPTVLLLDEATSALDATSEKAVTEALEGVMKERTTLFIAHRLTTAARADRILVLSKGQVLEEGSHAELMQANGAYAGLFRAFSGGILS